MFEILKLLLAALIILFGGSSDGKYTVESKAMEPALKDGQTIIVVPIQPEEIQRFDLILYEDPDHPDEFYVKRVIGLSSETIEMRGGQTFINDELLDEPFETNPLNDNYHFGPILIGDTEYFVMGDNRPNSKDSRVIRPIPAALIRGKVKSTL